MSSEKLLGKRVWITGASSGLGEALARWAAREGADLVLSARRERRLEEVRQTLERPFAHQVVPFDLAEVDSISGVVELVGRVDYLINNGGISQRDTALKTSLEVTRRIMEVNFFGNVELTRLVAPQMVYQRSGHIVTTSSVVGHIGTPLRSSYAASKHALHGYYDSLRYELADSGIRVSIISPGYIRTDISRNAVVGDGSAQGTMDKGQANGMSPARFAEKAWKGILGGNPEILIGGRELAGIYVKRYAPGLLDRIMQRRNWDNE